jgi:hypothetical protein
LAGRGGSPVVGGRGAGRRPGALPAALAKRNDNFKNRASADPETKCYLLGVPRITYAGFPLQITQQPAQLTMLYEWAHATRAIYTNGTPHPPGHIDWWMGDSRTIRIAQRRIPDDEFWEFACHEGNHDPGLLSNQIDNSSTQKK